MVSHFQNPTAVQYQNLVGMFNIVILCELNGGQHQFVVANKGPAKSCGAFSDDVIPNDLLALDTGLRDFLGWPTIQPSDDAQH